MDATSKSKPMQAAVFVPSARTLRTLYMNIPGFKSDHISVYDVLYHYWNYQYKYSFPPIATLCIETGFSDDKIRKLLRELNKWNLIETRKSDTGANNIYFLSAPIESESEFYSRFPEALQYRTERIANIEARTSKPTSKQRKMAAPVQEIAQKEVLLDWL
ncbi:hypothetical protein [Marinicrinis sediminis]|uniref:Helix-turn-helix domain-containing protein n=1 Tax=Marinicrinis sediminis TaxID=1652465 RepID=A0ABW5RCV6_9BACL